MVEAINNKEKNRICIIIPYYGKWPPFLNLFLKSVEGKPLDFLFITDLNPPNRYPGNISFFSMTIENLNDRIKSKLEIESNVLKPYKLCDAKPTYGLLFEELLKGYEFWGWGDIDLIYGDVKSFINDEVLNSYDIITGRSLWISGAFTILRNTDFIKNIFRQNDDYQKVLQEEKHFSFTECGKQFKPLREGKNINEVELEISNMTLIVNQLTSQGRLSLYSKNILRESILKNGYIKLSDGHVYDQDKREYLLYHYVTEKRRRMFRYPMWNLIPDSYYITETGFYLEKEFRSSFFHLIGWKRKIQTVPFIILDYYKKVRSKLLSFIKIR